MVLGPQIREGRGIVLRMEAERPSVKRDLVCTSSDSEELQRTAIELLRMNSAKKKGLLATLEYVATRLDQAGLMVTVDQGSETPLIIASKGKGGWTLWGNLDTERLGGMGRKGQGKVSDGIIYGRGVANMKGAVAAMVCAAEKMAPWDVPYSIILTSDGLGEQKGAEYLATNPVVRDSRGILMLRPTGLRPVTGQAGYAAFKASFGGEDPILRMAGFLNRVKDRTDDGPEGLLVRMDMIRGGRRKRPCETAQSSEVVLEMLSLRSIGSALKIVEEMLQDLDGTMEVLGQSEMVEFDRSSELVDAVVGLTGKGPAFEIIHSEAAKIVSANPRVCICGPGTTPVAISNIEYLTLSELERTFETILRLVDRSAEPAGSDNVKLRH